MPAYERRKYNTNNKQEQCVNRYILYCKILHPGKKETNYQR